MGSRTLLHLWPWSYDYCLLGTDRSTPLTGMDVRLTGFLILSTQRERKDNSILFLSQKKTKEDGQDHRLHSTKAHMGDQDKGTVVLSGAVYSPNICEACLIIIFL